jgi:hypothetical protein
MEFRETAGVLSFGVGEERFEQPINQAGEILYDLAAAGTGEVTFAPQSASGIQKLARNFSGLTRGFEKLGQLLFVWQRDFAGGGARQAGREIVWRRLFHHSVPAATSALR